MIRYTVLVRIKNTDEKKKRYEIYTGSQPYVQGFCLLVSSVSDLSQFLFAMGEKFPFFSYLFYIGHIAQTTC